MALKGGLCFLLLVVVGAILASPPDTMGGNKPNYRNVAKKLMMKCHEKGFQVPQMTLLETVFNESNVPVKGRDGNQAGTLLPTFLRLLNSTNNMAPVSPRPAGDPDKMKSKPWKCRRLSAILRKMRNSTEAPACYMRAFMAPMAWASLSAQCNTDMDSDEFDAVLWAAKPVLEESPSARRGLLAELDAGRMKLVLKTLQGVYSCMADSERTSVAKWAKKQILRNALNCTAAPPSDPSSRLKKRCEEVPQRRLDLESLTVMGSFMSHMSTEDVDSSHREKVRDFFRSGFLDLMKDAKPSRCKWFLRIFQASFSGDEFIKNLDKLGPLTCCLGDLPDLPPEISRKVLAQLERCNSFKATNLKKRLVDLYMRMKTNRTQALQDLGRNVQFLTSKHFLSLSAEARKEILKSQSVQWTENQQCMLVKKQLGDKCKEISYKEMKEIPSLVKALPVCMIKLLKADELLKDPEALKNLIGKMRKGQLKALLQKLPPDVLKMKTMPERLVCSASLSSMKKANITSVEVAGNRTWCRSQAAYLATMIKDGEQVKFRNLRSILRGLSCKVIEKAANIKELAQALATAPQWVSKTQVRCAAWKLFSALEKERKDYFKTIDEEELDGIQTEYILHMSVMQLKDLPDSVCPTFLMKLEQANLSTLPLRAWSRPALTNRALRCLTIGKDLSALTMADVSTLGELVCELPPAKLALMAPEVVNSTLETMAGCEHVPGRHRKDLIGLVKKTFGDPSNWTAETTETIGPLLMLDDDAATALPKKPWMKDVFYFLMSKRRRLSNALKRKWFELVTEATDGQTDVKPTEQLIDEAGIGNIYWKPSQLEQMSNQTFLAAAETLGSHPGLGAEQLAVLRRKATQVFGPVSKMAECNVMQLGCLTRGFSDPDLENLPFSLDSLEEMAKCGWTESQMKSVWRGIAKRHNLTAPRLGAADMVSLNRFMCGLSAGEIQQLDTEAFKDAVGSMDDLRCAPTTMKRFKRLAVSAFGDPRGWKEGLVSELSSIVARFDPSELASLDPSVFSFIQDAFISQIPPDSFKALSDNQLKSLGPDNAAMVTTAQLDALGVSQRAALDEAAAGPRSSPTTTEESGKSSGPPSLSMEGISAMMKPLLFLCMGFLLL